MGILLNEHLYLRENGTDIEYVDESAAELKDKISGAIDAVIKQVSSLWDRLVSWVQDRIDGVVIAAARAGIDKNKALEYSKLASGSANNINVGDKEYRYAGEANIKQIIKEINGLGSDNPKVKDKYDIKDYTTIFKPNEEFAKAAYATVFKDGNKLLNEIRDAKKTAIDALNSNKDKIRKSTDDNKADKLKLINQASRAVSKLSAIGVKCFHLRLEVSVAVIKQTLKIHKDNKELENPSSNKRKRGVKVVSTKESAIFSDNRFFAI